MKKFLLLCASTLVLASVVHAGRYGRRNPNPQPKPMVRYQVTVQNLTKGQPLTPPVIAAHSDYFKAVPLGKQASEGLAALALDGVTAELEAELRDNRHVKAVAVGQGVILPGEKQSIEIAVPYNSNNSSSYFSVYSMLARTNDAFIGGTFYVFDKDDKYLSVYDAGVEDNTEDCAHIPAPPCGNHGQGTGGEGFVRPHEGLHLQRDLTAARDTFANVAAQVTIKRR